MPLVSPVWLLLTVSFRDSRDCVFGAKKRSYDTSTRTRKSQEKRARLQVPETAPTAENLVRATLPPP